MFRTALLSAACLLAIGACTQPESTETAGSEGAASTPATVTVSSDSTALPLPIPINSVMVSLVDFAADGIWRPAGQDEPMTDKQWLMAEKDAADLVASATLITTAGTGVNDAEWVKEADWLRWSTEMQQVALEAQSAVQAKDKERLRLVGDRLVEVCQTCHQKYKPGLPSMGITRFPVYPKYQEQ
ncbi:MAG: hypothetical protein R3C52_02370 [Hyphomonadaceae bacterium]